LQLSEGCKRLTFKIHINYGDNYVASQSLVGVAPTHPKIDKTEMIAGRFINEIDMKDQRKNVVLCCNWALISPLPAPSRNISMKIPQATANPVSEVRSLLRFDVLHISLINSLMFQVQSYFT
jgi:hypothetical protein